MIKRFRILSDLHSEFFSSVGPMKFNAILKDYVPSLPTDKKTILLLAGDIGTYSNWNLTYGRVLEYFSKRFAKVVVIPGNHSYYNSREIVWNKEKEFINNMNLPDNVIYLENDKIIIDDDTLIIGATLWTDFDKNNPIYMNLAQRKMNDYNYIFKDSSSTSSYTSSYSSTIGAQDVYDKHIKSKNYIIDTLNNLPKNIKNIIVITHHSPSFQSVESRFRGDELNPAYCSDLEDIMLDYNVAYWIHGHQHGSNDYVVGNTRIISNPVGYHRYEVNPKYNKNLMIEID